MPASIPSPAGGPAEAAPRPVRRSAVFFFLLAFLVYMANVKVIATGDTRATRFLPFAVLHSGSLTLEDFQEQVVGFFTGAYWARWVDGRLVSMYPIVTPLLVTPLYVPATLYLEQAGWERRQLAFLAAFMEKLSAAAVAAASVALVYVLLRRRAPHRDARLLTLAYAFGTNTWATSSQALWQHGPAELLLAASLLAVTGAKTPPRLALAGVCSGLLAANRPPNLLLAAGIALYVLLDRELDLRRRAWFFLSALLVGSLFLAYNLHFFHHPLGGYVRLVQDLGGAAFLSHSPLAGIAGLLASPGKGLFVFSPFLLFLLARPFGRGQEAPQGDRLLNACLALGAFSLLFLYAKADWRGGYGYGPRFLVDLLPLLVWWLVPVMARLRPALRAVFVAGVLVAVPIQIIGAVIYPMGRSDTVLAAEVENNWRPGNAQFLLELRALLER